MNTQGSQLLVLLRGINVGGRRKVEMAALRALAEDCGHTEVRTYIASGNLLLRTDRAPSAVVDELGVRIEAHFGFAVDLVVRTADAWRVHAETPAWSDAAETRPKLLHLGVAGRPALPTAESELAHWAKDEERVAVVGDAVWIDYANGAGRSGLSPKRLDKAFGTPVTCRNYRTVRKLAELLGDD